MFSIGFRAVTKIDRPSRSVVDSFANVSSAELADAMNEAHIMDPGIRPIYEPMNKVVGTAVTISIPRGSHFYLFKFGAQQSRPGDVLVVNARGDLSCGLIGGNVCKGFRARGLAGVVVDGAVRDVDETRETQLPVYARGVTPAGGSVYGPGEVNVPIACGNVVVHPGDIVVADRDGIAIVPPLAAEEILASVRKAKAQSAALQPALARGEITNIEAITQKLLEMGCKVD